MAQVLPAETGLRRVIGDSEGIFPDQEGVADLEDADLLALYRRLVLLRTYDERSVVFHREGGIGASPIFWNHAAIQVRAVSALANGDWILPATGSWPRPAARMPRRRSSRGRAASRRLVGSAGFGVASICVPIATHVPHAARLRVGKRLRGEQTCALVFFGDGATSEGAFHEGANFAAVLRVPLVFLCYNNQWAISTPLEAQTAAAALVDKAVGYGMPGVRVDGATSSP